MASARVAIYFGGDLKDWKPPPCTGWALRAFTVLVVLIMTVSNAQNARVSIFETLEPGRHAFFYALYRRPDGRWRIYGLMRTGNGPSILAATGRKSYGNRAVALYRYLGGEDTARAPALFP